jgi:2-methylcitrate dehydratase PrpD
MHARSAPLAPQLARFAVGLDPAAIPAEVARAAKLHLLDALGCGIAASALGVATHARAAAHEAAPGATVIGAAARATAPDAALANGALCHGLDFDDTHPGSICHISAVVGPATLAAAEEAGADGPSALAALVAGNEVVARIGMLASPSYMTRGFHPTSVCGVFGAVAAAARVRGLSVAVAAHALGIAGSQASGLFEYLADGSATKQLHPGWAAHAGLYAARLAEHGATGPETVLEGRFGLLPAYFGQDVTGVELALPPQGVWETPKIAFKPYPACHFVHSCVDAAAALARERALAADDVARIDVWAPAPGLPLVLEPREAKIAPRTPYDAKFSLQYSVAAMLVHGEVGVATYTPDAIRDPRVLEVAARVHHEARAFASYPEAFPGAVRLTLADGRVLEREVPYQRGGPNNPMDDDEVLAKFRANARLGLEDADIAALEQSVMQLEQLDDLRLALAPLARVTTPTTTEDA